ncbi:hypothetical protein ABKN59_011475 [Abortiporus biennis]
MALPSVKLVRKDERVRMVEIDVLRSMLNILYSDPGLSRVAFLDSKYKSRCQHPAANCNFSILRWLLRPSLPARILAVKILIFRLGLIQHSSYRSKQTFRDFGQYQHASLIIVHVFDLAAIPDDFRFTWLQIGRTFHCL